MTESQPLPEEWLRVEKVLAAGPRRLLLFGPPGTGKTYAARHVGIGKRRVFNTYVTAETPAYMILGSDVIHDGTMIWRDGTGTSAARVGGRYVVNEIDKASDDALDALVALCDDEESAGFLLPNGEYIEPAKGYQVVATTNGTPRDLPEALRSRFSISLPVMKPHPLAVEKLPPDLRPVAITLCDGNIEASRRMNIRQFHGYAELTDLGVDPETAAAATFADKARSILDSMAVART